MDAEQLAEKLADLFTQAEPGMAARSTDRRWSLSTQPLQDTSFVYIEWGEERFVVRVNKVI